MNSLDLAYLRTNFLRTAQFSGNQALGKALKVLIHKYSNETSLREILQSLVDTLEYLDAPHQNDALRNVLLRLLESPDIKKTIQDATFNVRGPNKYEWVGSNEVEKLKIGRIFIKGVNLTSLPSPIYEYKTEDEKKMAMAPLLAGAALAGLANVAMGASLERDVTQKRKRDLDEEKLQDFMKRHQGYSPSLTDKFLYTAATLGKDRSLGRALKILIQTEDEDSVKYVLRKAVQDVKYSNPKIARILDNILAKPHVISEIKHISSNLSQDSSSTLLVPPAPIDENTYKAIKTMRSIKRVVSSQEQHVQEEEASRGIMGHATSLTEDDRYDYESPPEDPEAKEKRAKLALYHQQRFEAADRAKEEAEAAKKEADALAISTAKAQADAAAAENYQQARIPATTAAATPPTRVQPPTQIPKTQAQKDKATKKLEAQALQDELEAQAAIAVKEAKDAQDAKAAKDAQLKATSLAKAQTDMAIAENYAQARVPATTAAATSYTRVQPPTQNPRPVKTVVTDGGRGAVPLEPFAPVQQKIGDSPPIVVSPNDPTNPQTTIVTNVNVGLPKVPLVYARYDKNGKLLQASMKSIPVLEEEPWNAAGIYEKYEQTDIPTFMTKNPGEYKKLDALYENYNQKLSIMLQDQPINNNTQGGPLPFIPPSISPAEIQVDPNVAPRLDTGRVASSLAWDLSAGLATAAATAYVYNKVGPVGANAFANGLSQLLQLTTNKETRTQSDQLGSQVANQILRVAGTAIDAVQPTTHAEQIMNPFVTLTDGASTSITVQDVLSKSLTAGNQVKMGEQSFRKWYADLSSPYAVE